MSSALLYLAHGGGAQRRALQSPSPEWTLVFRQNVTNDPSWLRVAGQFSVNPGDPANAQYSILDTLENFRWADGKFTLQLRWPVAQDYSSLLPQTWRQSTNPATTTTSGVDGYEAIDVPYTGEFWFGLERSSNRGDALIDGSDHGRWWYVVGCRTITPGDGLMPGPGRIKVRVTELYASSGPSPPDAQYRFSISISKSESSIVLSQEVRSASKSSR